MRNPYFKPENKTDNSDFTIFGMKFGPVLDLQELPYRLNVFLPPFSQNCMSKICRVLESLKKKKLKEVVSHLKTFTNKGCEITMHFFFANLGLINH